MPQNENTAASVFPQYRRSVFIPQISMLPTAILSGLEQAFPPVLTSAGRGEAGRLFRFARAVLYMKFCRRAIYGKYRFCGHKPAVCRRFLYGEYHSSSAPRSRSSR